MVSKSFVESILYIRVSKPPSITDLVRYVSEGVVPTRLTDTEEFKYELARLDAVKSVEELDNVLLELLTNDLNEVYSYLPDEYVSYLEVLLESSELDLIHAILTGSNNPSVKDLRFTNLQHYEVCGGKGFSCIISKHLSRVKEVCELVGEDYEPAVAIAALYDILHYVKYLDNLRVLGLKGDIPINELVVEGIRFFKGIGSLYFEVGLEGMLKTSKKYETGSMERFAEDVLTLYQVAKDALYYRGGLLNLITLYGIDRLLRYGLLRALFSRWLRPW